MSNSKRAIDVEGWFSRNSELLKAGTAGSTRAHHIGVAGDALVEACPQYIKAPCENVIEGQNNSMIVLGRDRPGSRLSGYGGMGDTQASMIDLCVGRMAWNPKSDDGAGNVVFADPNFTIDSARIYISQKTDIDENFNLVDGNVGKSQAKSAIGLKADAIRVIAREGIKLVTRTDPKNSQGADVKEIVGIDLIAGNDDEKLQPIPVGDNLVEFSERILDHINALNGIVTTFVMQQMQFNAALSHHTHLLPILGMTLNAPVVTSSGLSTVMSNAQTTMVDLAKHKSNLVNCRMNYLTKAGKGYINSRYNKVN